ncbi:MULTISPECIES: nitrite reductase small subunit NirD [Kitasatospora]|uniref:Putative oxidoreductase n=1 Tax=Kitasatospora setae (strain ATCC 33774 / DSM 43861 / JCM 3304 / KCC A-0304 / NBRC 14216 / KM-6054) TaxID=452652 RepID=E4NBK3_KITSK|nr:MULTISPECIES: nitrite reductase small subunit NirD [Kitasatospora]BAJ28584.1 putative oxidoreductase [Kitasatospora setae KM-6054]
MHRTEPARAVELGTPDGRWIAVCDTRELEPDSGTAVLLPGGGQAAVFRTADGEVLAVGNRDPFADAWAIADGITGSVDGAPTVSSPLHKRLFDLRTGVCLDDPSRALPVWPVRLRPAD